MGGNRASEAASFAIVCRPGAGGKVAVSILVTTAEVVATRAAAALLLSLLQVRRHSDGLPNFLPVGEILRLMGRHHGAHLDRKALRRLIHSLQSRLAHVGIDPLVLQSHRTLGIRLAARPEQVMCVARA
jgi:hypothetical protein